MTPTTHRPDWRFVLLPRYCKRCVTPFYPGSTKTFYCAYCSGKAPIIPSHATDLKRTRNAAIMADHLNGTGYTGIARRYGITRQRVSQIIKHYAGATH